MENKINGRQQLSFVCCKQKTEMANCHLFAANGNGKQKFVFLGWQMFQHMCRSMATRSILYDLQQLGQYTQGCTKVLNCTLGNNLTSIQVHLAGIPSK
jgi:hypothetical protein